MSALLDIKNLNVQFDTDEGRIVAVENISLSVNAGEVLGSSWRVWFWKISNSKINYAIKSWQYTL